MHIMNSATEAAAATAADRAGDLDWVSTVLISAIGGGGFVKLVDVLAGRRKSNAEAVRTGAEADRTEAEAEKVLGEVMRGYAQGIVELMTPLREELMATRHQHSEDVRDLRAQHSRAMERVTGEFEQRIGAMSDMVQKLSEENHELREQLTVVQDRQGR